MIRQSMAGAPRTSKGSWIDTQSNLHLPPRSPAYRDWEEKIWAGAVENFGTPHKQETQPMTHDAELTVNPPTEPARSAAAERMRLHRERRRNGMRCLTIELHETEIDGLIRRGLLRADMRNDPSAVSDALYAFLDGTLG